MLLHHTADVQAPAPDRLAVTHRRGLLAVVLAGALALTLVVRLPSLRFGVERPTLHAQIATAAALVALLVALLAAGRYRRRPLPGDLLLALALAVLGTSNLLFSAIPAATGRAPGAFATWMPASGRLLAAGLLAAAAFAPRRALPRPAHAARLAVAGSLTVLAVAALALLALAPALAPPERTGELLAGNAGAIALKAISAGLIGLAAIGFATRGRRRLDWFAVLLSWGTALLAFGWLNYLLVPSLYVDWFYAGDVLGLGAYVLLAAGAVAEIRSYQRDRTRLAASEERGRVARELHDGVAQELAYVLSQTRRLHRERPTPATAQLVSAAERALDESRSAISTLRAPLDEPLHVALERAAGELGRRLELDVRIDVEHSVEVTPPVREAVMRIVGEALANAARHGGAQTAAIELRAGAPRRLTVRDDGCGFDPDPLRIPDGSYGLLSIRERVEAFGGRLAIRSAPGVGTEIEVALP